MKFPSCPRFGLGGLSTALRYLAKAASGTWLFLRFFGRRLYNRWNDDHVFFSAAAISFNVLITILPLGLLIVTFSGIAFQEDSELQVGLQSWMETANPLIPESARTEIETALFSGRTGIPGLIGFLFLLWLVSRLFGTIRTAFDTIFEVPKGRNIVLGKLYDFLLALLVAVCFVAAILFTAMARLITDSTIGEIVSSWPLIGHLTGEGVASILGTTFTVLLFFMLFKAAPNRKVGNLQAVTATIIATVFTWLGTQLYIWTVSHPSWGIVYGSLASIMATFFLLYWECVILLGAAEISQIGHEWRRVSRSTRSMTPRE